MRRCKQCLLPDEVPGAELDTSGVCRYCRSYARRTGAADDEALRAERKADLEAALRASGGPDVMTRSCA